MKPKEITIYDIASHLNIAASTVSRGLKGHHTVSIKTQKKIVETAREMGYHSNLFAAGLRTKRTNTIGLIIPRINSDFMASVISGIEKVVNNAGFTLIITQSLESKEKEIKNTKTLFAQRVDGLLVSLSEDTTDTKHFNIFLDKHIPLLFFDRAPDDVLLPAVIIDDEAAAYQATQHLIFKGAKRIVHISSNQKISTYRKRFEGYIRALEDHNLPFDSEFLILNSLTEDTGTETAQKVIALKADAIFSANDVAAAACMNTLKIAGINIPDDIMVSGFNNDIISRNVSPPLTTIANPGFQIGELAARNLIACLTDRTSYKIHSSTILNSELIVRGSTKC